MGAFGVFTEKYLCPYGWRGSKFMAVANYTNPSTEIQSNVIETQIVEV